MSGKRPPKIKGQLIAGMADDLRTLLDVDPDGRLPPVMLWAKAIAASDLPATARAILRTLGDEHMDANGGSCFPSVETQALETGFGARTVQRSLRLAGDLGWLGITGSRGRRANVYEACIPVGFQPRQRGTVEPGQRDRVIATAIGGDEAQPRHRDGVNPATQSPNPATQSPNPATVAPERSIEGQREIHREVVPSASRFPSSEDAPMEQDAMWERRMDALDQVKSTWRRLGWTARQLEEFTQENIGRKIEELGPEEMEQLRSLLAAVKEAS